MDASSDNLENAGNTALDASYRRQRTAFTTAHQWLQRSVAGQVRRFASTAGGGAAANLAALEAKRKTPRRPLRGMAQTQPSPLPRSSAHLPTTSTAPAEPTRDDRPLHRVTHLHPVCVYVGSRVGDMSGLCPSVGSVRAPW